MEKTEVRIVPEEAFWPLFNQAGARPLKDAAVTCPKCNQPLLETDDLKKIAKEKVAHWQQEKVWNGFPVHCDRMSAKCPRCGAQTYVTIAFLRFYPDRFYPAVKAYAAVFKTEKEQQQFTDGLNRILAAGENS
jgi:hypothetical protein